MKRFVCVMVLLLATFTPTWAQDIVLPPTVAVKPGRLTKLQAQTQLTNLQWVNLSDDVDLIPSDTGQWVIICVNPSKGCSSYKIAAYGAKLDENGKAVPTFPVYVTLTCGDGPAPTPSDPFMATLSSAWALETGPNKVADATALASAYRAAVGLTTDQSLTTVGEFFAAFRKSVDASVDRSALPVVRPTIGKELTKYLPTTAASPMDASTRALIAQHYNRIADDLNALK